jgi:hypothetical protein
MYWTANVPYPNMPFNALAAHTDSAMRNRRTS